MMEECSDILHFQSETGSASFADTASEFDSTFRVLMVFSGRLCFLTQLASQTDGIIVSLKRV
jgi:hypothetical protein